MFTPTDPLPANVRAALERGSSIEAIKLLREATGLGLKEAKDVIDQQVIHPAPVTVSAPPIGLPPEVFAALHQGNKIEAIRLLREKTGVGLKQAKETVESFQAQSNVASSRRSPGEVPKLGTSAWIVAALVVLLVFGYLIFWRSG